MTVHKGDSPAMRHMTFLLSGAAFLVISGTAAFLMLGHGCAPANESADGSVSGLGTWTGSLGPGVLSGGVTNLGGNSSVGNEGDPSSSDPTFDGAPAADAILVSIVLHVEEDPDYSANQTLFERHRAGLVRFAQLLDSYEVKLNYQSDWSFLKAIIAFDNGDDSTNGKNVLRYLQEDLKVEIDPHAHESQYSYADVAYLIELNGVPSSGVVGGFIASPVASSKLEYFWAPIQGEQYASTSWTAQLLWGGGTGNHVNEEGMWASGIWRPKSAAEFHTHDAGAPLPLIGNFGGTWANLDLLLELRAAGKLQANAIHTSTITTNARDIVSDAWVEQFEAELSARRGDDGIRWVGLNEAFEIWEQNFGGVANTLTYTAAQTLR